MDRYALLLVSMSLADAKVTLGFPPNAEPSPTEIHKAWREQAFKNHPDRGGDSAKMVEINVAKDVLEGKQRPTYERPGPSADPDWAADPGAGRSAPPPAREPAKKQEVTFDEARNKAGIPAGVNWMFVTEGAGSGYSSDEHMRRVTGWVFYGQTDQKHVFVSAENLTKEDYYIGAGPGINIWSIRTFDYPRKEGEVLQPAWLYGNIVKAFKGFQYVEKRFNSKVMPLPEGWHFSEKIPHAGKTVSLKHWLVNQGFVSGDDPSVVSRKNVIELVVTDDGSHYSYSSYSKEQGKPVEPPTITLNINGKDFKLLERDAEKFYVNYPKNVLNFIFGDYYYKGSNKTLTRLAPARKKKIFEWMLKSFTGLSPEVRAVIEVEAAK